jgi:hypothetical protein
VDIPLYADKDEAEKEVHIGDLSLHHIWVDDE